MIQPIKILLAVAEIMGTCVVSRSAAVSHVPRDEPVQLPAETYSRLSSDGEDNDLDDSSGGEKPDYPCVNFHPRPAAVSSHASDVFLLLGTGSHRRTAGVCYVTFLCVNILSIETANT